MNTLIKLAMDSSNELYAELLILYFVSHSQHF